MTTTTKKTDAIHSYMRQALAAQETPLRRSFFKKAGVFSAGVVGGAMLSACGGGGISTAMAAGPTDEDILNFALNLEYLEAQFYHYAAYGTSLDEGDLGSGTGTRGQVMIGGVPEGGAAFGDTALGRLTRQYALEITGDEVAHVKFLRSALGSAKVNQPAIDLRGDSPTSAFSNAARAAGLIGDGQIFNPYSSPENFLLAAFIFEDVGVTAYKGASPLVQSKVFLEAAAGILAAEAYHAGLVRTVLFVNDLGGAAGQISDARDSLDGTTASNAANGVADDDQGPGLLTDTQSNIFPSDANGIAYSRTPGQVLNIAYLSAASVTQGGFFPAGVNGTLVMSDAH